MPTDEPFALFDADDGGALRLTDLRHAVTLDAATDPKALLTALEATAATGLWIAVTADYALGTRFEPAAAARADPARPLLRAWAFARADNLDRHAVDDFLAERLAALPEAQRWAGVAELAPALTETAHAERVRRIGRWIADGDCYQINFTFPLNFRVYGHPLALYARLRQRQPVRYGGALFTDEATILSFSPELFFARHGTRVHTQPMKGTAPRGRTPRADAARRDALLTSAKERAENVMIVDLLRNDLGRLAQAGKVRVEALCAAEAYPTLWQMVSTVSAELPDATLADLFGALFPCGSIAGAPKIRAMRRIAELEDAPRGHYTGALGWLAPGGDCRFNVAIRSIEFDSDDDGQNHHPKTTGGAGRCARLGIGSGIVADADPRREYAECLLKARFLTAGDPGFELFETLRLTAGGYPLLTAHLERLRTSARALGFACPLATVTAALAEQHATLAARQASGEFRVRLTLTHDGRCRVVASPLPDMADSGRQRVVLAIETLAAGDYLRRHKTTARGPYDRALAALAGQPAIFDAIFLNERGEVCEGARSSVFVERQGVLLTPPLHCGLLPGVLRRTLLEAGRVVERVLRVDDLRTAPALYVGNALRGLLPVTLETAMRV
ncbi:MAG TPA: aminodeoxychorismate synthase component I [Accumulibacter sp.]|jgi:para-aminobenzoate synthetase/4-amino-4-deoxychorismate lyase|nr:aminodeoxychorismate synthase component I [Accumulibacter sp.]HQC79973.1 aminodeoxychorismate synthase component I [Accumulibacter sp.]